MRQNPWGRNRLCETHRGRLRRTGNPGLIFKRRWTPAEDAALLDLLHATPGKIGRAPYGELAELSVHLERSYATCNQRLAILRKRRLQDMGLDLIG